MDGSSTVCFWDDVGFLHLVSRNCRYSRLLSTSNEVMGRVDAGNGSGNRYPHELCGYPLSAGGGDYPHGYGEFRFYSILAITNKFGSSSRLTFIEVLFYYLFINFKICYLSATSVYSQRVFSEAYGSLRYFSRPENCET